MSVMYQFMMGGRKDKQQSPVYDFEVETLALRDSFAEI